jgi:hypothetical protein
LEREEMRFRAWGLHAPYCLRGAPIVELMAEPGFKVRRVARSEKDGKSLVTVYFAEAGFGHDGELFRRTGWFSVCPDDAWAVHEYESHTELADGRQVVWQGDVQYGPTREGIPTLQAVRTQLLRPDGREVEITTDVESLDFGPLPEEEFELASFGLEPPKEEGPVNERVDVFTRILRLALWSLATVTLTLVLAVGLQLVRRRA